MLRSPAKTVGERSTWSAAEQSPGLVQRTVADQKSSTATTKAKATEALNDRIVGQDEASKTLVMISAAR